LQQPYDDVAGDEARPAGDKYIVRSVLFRGRSGAESRSVLHPVIRAANYSSMSKTRAANPSRGERSKVFGQHRQEEADRLLEIYREI
jgi:hypothetical protein